MYIKLIKCLMIVPLLYSAVFSIDLPDGFASASGRGLNTTTGGEGGERVTVSTWSDLKEYAESSDPYIILIEGTIPAPSKGDEVHVESNTTIVGLGDDAILDEAELNLMYVSNVIIRNITIRDSYLEGDEAGKENDFDAIQADGSHHLWIDHCHFTNCGDGLIDLRKVCDYVTISWVHLSNHNKAFGIGWTEETDYGITIHHTYFDGTRTRNPSFDMGRGHLYNNYVRGADAYGNFSRGEARLIIENSVFEDSNEPVKVDASSECYVSNLEFINCDGNQSGNVSSMPYNLRDYYDYTLDSTSEVKSIVTSGVGPNAYIGDQYLENIERYTLTVNVESGEGIVTPEGGEYQEDRSISVEAVPEPGWKFDHWEGDLSGNTNPASITMTNNKSISAYFVKDTLFIPGKIEAEKYSSMSGIETEECSEGGENIGFINDGDWAEYSVYVTEAGDYSIDFRVASNNAGGNIVIKTDEQVSGSVEIVSTGGWQEWEDFSAQMSFPDTGFYTIRLEFSGGEDYLFNISEFTAERNTSVKKGIERSEVLPGIKHVDKKLILKGVKSGNMSIFDVKGRLVDRIKIEGDMYGKGVYSVDHLVSGIYVLELKTTTRSMKRDVLLLR